jgi:hypothetical protein
MKPEKQTTLQGCTTAFEMWSRIQTEYALVSAESEPLLWGQFYSYRFRADQSIMNFIAGIEQIAAQLRDIWGGVDDTQIMAKILVSLPSSLQYFFGGLGQHPTRSQDTLISNETSGKGKTIPSQDQE